MVERVKTMRVIIFLYKLIRKVEQFCLKPILLVKITFNKVLSYIRKKVLHSVEKFLQNQIRFCNNFFNGTKDYLRWVSLILKKTLPTFAIVVLVASFQITHAFNDGSFYSIDGQVLELDAGVDTDIGHSEGFNLSETDDSLNSPEDYLWHLLGYIDGEQILSDSVGYVAKEVFNIEAPEVKSLDSLISFSGQVASDFFTDFLRFLWEGFESLF